MVSRTAACTCGALKVTTEGEPSLVIVCNCSLCQRRTGSVFGVSAYFPKTSVRVSGQARLFTQGSDSGRKASCYFCPECGTTLFWDAEYTSNKNRTEYYTDTISKFGADIGYLKSAVIL